MKNIFFLVLLSVICSLSYSQSSGDVVVITPTNKVAPPPDATNDSGSGVDDEDDEDGSTPDPSTVATTLKEPSRHTISAGIRRLKWSNGREFPPKARKEQNTHRCLKAALEKSVFFPREGSYLVAKDKFYVGRATSMTLEIKPRVPTGLIYASVDSDKPEKGDYLVLELNKGAVVARLQNGHGEVSVVWEPEDGMSLCDNKWHAIVLAKSGNKLKLRVDGVSVQKTGEGTASIANVYKPVYIGGVPDHVASVGLRVRSSYQGCMRNLKLRGSKRSFASLARPVKLAGDVSLCGCPKKYQQRDERLLIL